MCRWVVVLLSVSLLVGCGDTADPDFAAVSCADFAHANCISIPGGDSAALLDAVNSLDDDTVLVLGLGTFELDNQVTIRADRICVAGQGMNATTLSFGTATTQINGVDAISDGFLIQDLTVLDAPKDGIRVEVSNGVTFRRIRATWSNPGLETNGAYGIYPVRSQNVLVEDSVADRSSDAGLYVGQCMNVIVRNNMVRDNVAGLEIENTQYADVYGNTAENNTAGIVVFDLPGNPIVGRDVRLRDNVITNNNHPNFAPAGTTVSIIPSGTGTFAMASRRVEITNNTYEGNDTGDIAVLSGLVAEPVATLWDLNTADLTGDWMDLGLAEGTTAGTITNARTENIVISGNTHSGSGTNPDRSADFGTLLAAVYGTRSTSSILYDGIGEPLFSATDASMTSNENRICAGGNPMAAGFAVLDVATQLLSIGSPILVIADSPFAPFDCTTMDGGAVAEVLLP